MRESHQAQVSGLFGVCPRRIAWPFDKAPRSSLLISLWGAGVFHGKYFSVVIVQSLINYLKQEGGSQSRGPGWSSLGQRRRQRGCVADSVELCPPPPPPASWWLRPRHALCPRRSQQQARWASCRKQFASSEEAIDFRCFLSQHYYGIGPSNKT